MSLYNPMRIKALASAPRASDYYRAADTGLIPEGASCATCNNYNAKLGLCTPKRKKVAHYNRCEKFNHTFVTFADTLQNKKDVKK